jgi:hypothetical membrane protein
MAMAVDEGLVRLLNYVLIAGIFVLLVYYLLRAKRLDEISRRLLLVGFFFAIHELSFFLNDPMVFELTNTLFFIVMFYALVYIASMNKRLEKKEEADVEMLGRLEKLREELEGAK